MIRIGNNPLYAQLRELARRYRLQACLRSDRRESRRLYLPVRRLQHTRAREPYPTLFYLERYGPLHATEALERLPFVYHVSKKRFHV